MLNKSKSFKATILFGVSSFVTSGLNYIFTPFFTRILSKTEYGQISIYNSFFAIVSVIATLCLSRPGVISVGMYENKEKRFWFIKNLSLVIIFVGTVVFGLILVFYDYFVNYINLSKSLLLLMYFVCITQPANAFWLSKEKYEYNYKLVSIVTITTALISQMFSVVCVYLLRNSNYNLAEIRLISAGIINIIVSVAIYVFIYKNGAGKFSIFLCKKYIVFAFPLIPHYLGFSLLNGIDKLMIGNMIGEEKTAIYSLASTISNICMLIWSALQVSITPFMYSKLGEKKYNEIEKQIIPMLILVGIGCFCITLMSPEIILIFGSKEYIEGISVMPVIISGLFMHVVYDVFSSVAFFNKKSLGIAASTIIAAAFNVITNYVFIKKYGYIAAGYTTFVSFFILAFLHIVNSIRIEQVCIVNIKKLFIISLIVIISCLSCNILFEYGLLRYVILVGLIILVLMKRKYFIDAISSMEV